ncbi:MAG: Eco57I restriction-modification methylase domain-containing protein [Nitrospinales bacterium]
MGTSYKRFEEVWFVKMETITKLEKKRLEMQAALDNQKKLEDRNKLGQFATPSDLATDILKYAKKLFQPRKKVAFFDPAIGTGSFYSALLKTFPSSRIVQSKGFELDSLYGNPSIQFWEHADLDITLADFTKQELPKPSNRFNLIICNPPYVRHHHLLAEEKKRLQTLVQSVTGLKLSGLSGLYCYFLLLSHAWLDSDGIAGWLIPSEFMDVNYGRSIKHYLKENVTLLRIHRFNPNNVQFKDALVSSVVAWFRKTKPPQNHKVEFSFGGTLLEPKFSAFVDAKSLDINSKWTHYPIVNKASKNGHLKLSDLFVIKRGLATGSNKFFILSEEKINKLQLPKECFKPILPSPRYFQINEILADDKGYPDIENRLFLLDSTLSEEEIQKRYPNLWKYLSTGIKNKVNEQYLCRHRYPWYSQEKRLPAPMLCTYLGRSKANDGCPFRFILNNSNAVVANVYLNLYPKPTLARVLKSKPFLLKIIWKALNELQAETLLSEGRVYGGGLHKLEPKELGNVSANTIASLLPKTIRSIPQQVELFTDM